MRPAKKKFTWLFPAEIIVSEVQLLLFSGPINRGGSGVIITSFLQVIAKIIIKK